jgi:hypothetical protein
MVSLLRGENIDFVKLYGFFLFRIPDLSYWYYDGSGCMYEGKFSSFPIQAVTGFGFSYFFSRKILERFPSPFPDRDHGEDQEFIDNVLRSGFDLFGVQDQKRASCLHIEHGRNISICHPQIQLATSHLSRLFPTFPAAAYVTAAATQPARYLRPWTV